MQDEITDTNDAMAEAAKAAAEQRVQSIDEQLGNITKKVADKIKACENILVALSQNPSVDEISAALGLTMVLNKLGKHVTAIYSGETPNTLEFLNPGETFEKDTNSLQDFIIALSKDKADHLRYKVEGDYVKVYITPYKTTISQNDLEFSQGDFNVDLVISIGVESAEVLDAALEEYGRIMHDATAINITTDQAGHFAELEWSDPSMSSCCEMIVNLCEYLDADEFDQPTATALLTGIVASTERFSNARTTSETMQISSRLMQAGADQQLISSNIVKPVEEAPAEPEEPEPEEPEAPAEPETPPEPLIPAPTLGQTAPVMPEAPVAPEMTAAPEAPATPEVSAAPEVSTIPEIPVTPEPAIEPEPEAPIEPEIPAEPVAEPETTPATEPEVPVMPETPVEEPVVEEPAIAAPVAEAPAEEPEILVGTPAPVAPTPSISLEPSGPEGLVAPSSVTPEPIQQAAAPASDTFALPTQAPAEPALPQIISQGSVVEQNVAEPIPETPDYGSMIDQALSEAMAPQPMAPVPNNPAVQSAPSVPDSAPDATSIPNMEFSPAPMSPIISSTPEPQSAEPTVSINPVAPTMSDTPVASAVPAVPTTPEAPAQPIEVPTTNINIELPPPPVPVIDPNGGMPPAVASAPDPVLSMPPMEPVMPEAPAMPAAPVVPEVSTAPVEPVTPAAPAAPIADPSAFQIPQI